MNEVRLRDEICCYISVEDFNKLVSVPNLTEDDVDFSILENEFNF